MALRGLGGDIPPPDPTIPDPVQADIQTVKVQAISIWNALLIGTVTGFAVALGTVAFSRIARRVTGHEVVKTA